MEESIGVTSGANVPWQIPPFPPSPPAAPRGSAESPSRTPARGAARASGARPARPEAQVATQVPAQPPSAKRKMRPGLQPRQPSATRSYAAPALEHAVRYVEERHWDVVPGAWLEFGPSGTRCSCGDPVCQAPGAHPMRPEGAVQATGSASAARRLWTVEPQASILLPTGRCFDVLEVPEAAGCLALARMERLGTALGPVCGTPYGRMMFFVLPASAGKVPALTRRLGWAPGKLDLIAWGEGGYVPAPPTWLGPRGPVRWVREPTAENRWLPDVEALLPALAYACGQETR